MMVEELTGVVTSLVCRATQASELAGGMIALSRSRLAAGHKTFES
jgi:hypothetical protein